MYNNPYMNIYNGQNNIDRINAQISELEKVREQMQKPVQQPTNLTQNFQLAPSNYDIIKYANSIEEVQKYMVVGETPYFSKDMSVVWIKNTKGEIKTYELNEIVPKDDRDIQIELLQEQINQLKKEMNQNEQPITNNISTENETDTTGNDEELGITAKENKPTSISRVSTSKKK